MDVVSSQTWLGNIQDADRAAKVNIFHMSQGILGMVFTLLGFLTGLASEIWTSI